MSTSPQRWSFTISFATVAVVLLAIGIVSGLYVDKAENDKDRGDRRLVSAIFILVSIITMFYIYTVLLRDSMLKIRKAVRETTI